ncbi:MAG: methyl-accepting chemotaxis protein, partial [bacterium]
AKQAAEKGNGQMHDLEVAINNIQEGSQEIAKIMKVIDDIAFQTNLLALNAAVEAARAGKYGKGFAVVAEEVRNLASKSAKAAEETSGLIQHSISRVKQGTDMAAETAESLNSIVDGITQVATLVADISTASSEQSLAISQISIGLGQIDTEAQNNAALYEETSSSAQELASISADLMRVLSKFQTRTENQRLSGAESIDLGAGDEQNQSTVSSEWDWMVLEDSVAV